MQKLNTDPKEIINNKKSILTLQNVGFRYNYSSAEVLKDINLDIKQGDFYFLSGPSGAGKTSLLKLLHLAHFPTSGKIKIFNQDISSMDSNQMAKTRQKIGVIFQDYQLLNHLSVFDNVALPLRILNLNKQTIEKNVNEMLDWVKLGNFANSKPLYLSGGQQQKVALARAVIHKPDIIIADEPTGNLDNEMAQKILFLFLELNKHGTTFIMSSHNEELMKYFNAKYKWPILVLQNGRLYKK